MTAPTSDPAVRPGPTRAAGAVRAFVFTLVALAVDALLLGLALGGVLGLLEHARAIALLVVWAVSNFTLALLRPVHAQDVVKDRPDARFGMLALFLIPLFAPAVSAFGERAALATAPWDVLPAAMGDAFAWLAVAMTAAGLAIRITAMTRLGTRFSPRIAVQREHALETTGLYAKVRHPGYVGSLLATFGGVLAFQSMLAWPLLALMVVVQNARAGREEALLEAHFGEAYAEYRVRTGRFLPKF